MRGFVVWRQSAKGDMVEWGTMKKVSGDDIYRTFQLVQNYCQLELTRLMLVREIS